MLNSYSLFFFLAEAYDSLDPNGNITIKWDVMQWTPDGYVVSSTSIIRIFHLNLLLSDNFIL
jgi:hypothetical protein